MPFRSKRQRAWMYIHKPALAKKWTKKYGSAIKKKKKKTRKKRRTRSTSRKRK